MFVLFLSNRNFFRSQSTAKYHLIALVLLTMFVLTAFPAWVLPGQLGLDDLSHLNAPQRMLLPWFYLHGQWPLWNPFSFAGQPFLAAGQSGPLYLPNLVFLLLPIDPALKLSYVLHEWLAAFGMYLVVWRLGRRHPAALAAALAFATNGFLVGHFLHTQMFDAMTWLPLLFWLELRVLDQPSKSNAAWLAAAFALEIYAGHPQITFFALLTLSLYAGLHGLQNRQRVVWRGVLLVTAGLLVGVLLATAQWLPTLNLVSYSDRSDASSFFLLRGSWPWAGLVQFLTPFPAGGGYTGQPFSIDLYKQLFQTDLYWEYTAYAGAFSVVIGSAVAIRSFFRSEPVRNLVVIGTLALALAFGANAVFGSFLTHAPGFDLFRIPARYVGVVDFVLAILFGLGLASMQDHATAGKLRFSVGVSSLIYLILLVGARLWGPLLDSPPLAFWVPVALLTLLAVLSFLPRLLSTSGLTMTIAVLSIADGVFQAASMTRLTLVAEASYTHPSGAVQFLQKHLSSAVPFQRVAALNDTSSLELDMAAAYRIPALNGYDSLVPTWYTHFVNLTWGPDVLFLQPRSMLDALGVKYVTTAPGGSPYLPQRTLGIQSYHRYLPTLPKDAVSLYIRVSSVLQPKSTWSMEPYEPLFSVTLKSGLRAQTYLVSGTGATEYLVPLPADWPRRSATEIIIQNESWTRLTAIDSLWLANSRNAHLDQVHVGQVFGPQAFHSVFKSATEEIWQNPNPLLPAWIALSTTAPFLRSGEAALATWSANRQQWNINSQSHGVFVLSQMYDPNWRATVDGLPARVMAVDHVLTGVNVPPGQHEITLVYTPEAFTWGVATSGLTFLVWLSLISNPRRNLKRQKGLRRKTLPQ